MSIFEDLHKLTQMVDKHKVRFSELTNKVGLTNSEIEELEGLTHVQSEMELVLGTKDPVGDYLDKSNQFYGLFEYFIKLEKILTNE